MKNAVIYIIILSLFGLASCRDMDELYKEYIVPNGKTYPQKADLLKVYPGKNRVKISWQKPTDPSVTNAHIYWNYFTDSIKVDLASQTNGTISYIIDNLAEQSYTFNVITYDAKGNQSVPSEMTGIVYGEAYQATLLSRPVLFMYANQTGLNIQWGTSSASFSKVVIKYLSSTGNRTEKTVAPEEMVTVVPDFQTGSTFTIETHYLPEPFAIDEFVVTEEYTAE
jgi:hypothetical protein